MSTASPTPEEFSTAVAGLVGARVRSEVELETLPAPKRLAPFSHAIAGTVIDPDSDEEIASGRLVLLYDPAGVPAWEGTTRIVVFITSEIEGEMAADPFLAEVAWSWLTDALDSAGSGYQALGGTVTATSSTRFGDLTGERRTDDLEIRASWSPLSGDSGPHMTAFAQLLAVAAGLPPEGIATIAPVPSRSTH